MRRVWAIAFKDLRRIYRTPSALALMLVAPLGLAALLGAAFGGDDAFTLKPVKVALVNLDTGVPMRMGPGGSSSFGGSSPVPLPSPSGSAGPGAAASPEPPGGVLMASSYVTGMLKSDQMGKIADVSDCKTADEARKAVDDGKVDVAVIIPAGFSNAVFGVGQLADIEVYENPTKQIGPPLIAGVVEQVVETLAGGHAAAVGAIQLTYRRGDTSKEIRAVARQAGEDYERRMQGDILHLEQRAPEVKGAGKKVPGAAVTILAGMMVFFMFIGAGNAARTVIEEEVEGTLPRMFATPTRRSEILGGKFGAAFLTVLIQTIVLLVGGIVLFHANWDGFAPAAVLTVVGAAVAACLALFLVSFAHTTAQAGAIPSGIYLVLALIGGNLTGSVAQSGALYYVQRLTPNGWLLIGWNDAMRGNGMGQVLQAAAVVLAFAVVFFLLSVWRFRRRYA